MLHAILWICFYGIHSFLAHNSTKEFVYQFGVNFKRYYRLSYNFISVIFFASNIYVMSLSNESFLIQSNFIYIMISAFLMSFGIAFLLIAFSIFNTSEFLGLEQMKTNEKVYKSSKLIIGGIYKYVRHPLYTGILFLLLGIIILFPSSSILTFAIISILYLPIGIHLEEKKLISEFGQQYIDYKKEVKMLIPFIF